MALNPVEDRDWGGAKAALSILGSGRATVLGVVEAFISTSCTSQAEGKGVLEALATASGAFVSDVARAVSEMRT